jgi:ATP-dependent Clp protease ATP-binding subunit ClpA
MNGPADHGVNPTELPLGPDLVQLIVHAKEESARLQHAYVGTQHLVLALSQQAGAAPLVALAVDPKRVHLLINQTITRGNAGESSAVERRFTSRTKRAFSLAAETARELAHAQIGVADLLVGLMRERMNIGAQVLADQGLTEKRAYAYARQSGAPGQS